MESKLFHSHGDGTFTRSSFRYIGENVIFEEGVLVFNPENIILGRNIYIGHRTILKGYYTSLMEIGQDTWIGQGCFIHSAGNVIIGKAVGIGPMVKILTSAHTDELPDIPIMHQPLSFQQVVIEDGADIGVGSVILPGVVIGKYSIIGAGSVVTQDVPSHSVFAGVPARLIRKRESKR